MLTTDNVFITVLTPTYNRLNLIKRLYESLRKQTNKRFLWLVIDDGSTDGTKEWFDSLDDQDINFEYHFKANGGKHRAINYSHSFVKGKYLVIVDSDDVLTDDAVETIFQYSQNYDDEKPSLLIFQRGDFINKEQFDKSHPGGPYLTTLVDLTNSGLGGDHCEVINTEVFKSFYFPEFDNEFFIGEAWLWENAGKTGKTVFINKVIYLCEYLEGGLTKSGRKMRIKNPRGGIEHARVFLDPCYKIKLRIKNSILFVCYSKFLHRKLKTIIKDSKHPFLVIIAYIPGCILKRKWARKYI